MSQWRREAIEQLPEFHKLITSELVDNPMMLWIELTFEFDRLCEKSDPPIDLLRRMWRYCEWCLHHRNIDVRISAALPFCEHLICYPATARMLPRIMPERRFLELRDLLLYLNSEEEIDRWHRELWPKLKKRGYLK